MSIEVKRQALDFFRIQADGTKNYLNLFYKIIASKQYGEKHLYELSAGKSTVIENLINNGKFDKYLHSENHKEIAVAILLSAQYSTLVAEYLKKYIEGQSNDNEIDRLLCSIDDIKSSDDFFEIKMSLIKKDIVPNHYVIWDEILKKNIDRAYKYIEVLFVDKRELKCKIDVSGNKNEGELNLLFNKYGKQINELTKNYLLALEDSKYKLRYYDSSGMHTNDNTDLAISLFIKTIIYQDEQTIWGYINDEDDTEFFRKTALSAILSMEQSVGYSFLKRIIQEEFIGKQNFFFNRNIIFELQNIVAKLSHYLTDSEFAKFEKQIVSYKRPSFIEHVKMILLHRKTYHVWTNFWGEEQKVLL